VQWLFKDKEATATVFDGDPMVYPDVWNDRCQGRPRGLESNRPSPSHDPRHSPAPSPR